MRMELAGAEKRSPRIIVTLDVIASWLVVDFELELRAAELLELVEPQRGGRLDLTISLTERDSAQQIF